MVAWLSSVAIDDRVVMCTIAHGEIPFGLGRLAHGRRRAELEVKAQKLFDIMPSQQRRGLPLDENDLWMAATALAINATLVSRDSDFQGVAGLAVVAP